MFHSNYFSLNLIEIKDFIKLGSELDEDVDSTNQDLKLSSTNVQRNELESQEHSVGKESAILNDTVGHQTVTLSLNDSKVSTSKIDEKEKEECKG